MGISMEAQKEAILEKSKKTMSVPEMRRLLGLKKTDSYWLVHRNFFQTYIVNGQMRVDIASFEKWYADQIYTARPHIFQQQRNWRKITSVCRMQRSWLE